MSKIKEKWEKFEDIKKVRFFNYLALFLFALSMFCLIISFPFRIVTPFDIPPAWSEVSPIFSGFLAVFLICLGLFFICVSFDLFLKSKKLTDKMMEERYRNE